MPVPRRRAKQGGECRAQHTIHDVARQGIQITQAGDVPQLVLHDGQQVDPIQGRGSTACNCWLPPGGKLFVARRRRVDEPAVAGRIGIQIHHVPCGLAHLGASQIADDEPHLPQLLHRGRVHAGLTPEGNGFIDNRLEIRLANVGRFGATVTWRRPFPPVRSPSNFQSAGPLPSWPGRT